MRSSGTDILSLIDIRDEDVLLNAVCLLPPLRWQLSARTAEVRNVQQQLETKLLTFGQRFLRCYFVTTTYGLVPWNEHAEADKDRYEEMHPEPRHRLLLTIEQQLKKATDPDLTIVALLTGKFMQGLRRLKLPMITPAASMSMYQRRYWLDVRCRQSVTEMARSIVPSAVLPLVSITNPPAELAELPPVSADEPLVVNLAGVPQLGGGA